jgi:hypothetical protein
MLINIGLGSTLSIVTNNTCTPTCVANVFDTTSYREFLNSSLINCFSLSSTKGQFLNSCPTCWQYAHTNAISKVGYVFITSILHWTCGCSTIPITYTLSGCVCWTSTCTMTAFIGFKQVWKPNQHGKLGFLHSCKWNLFWNLMLLTLFGW